jgi:hypothetical protein
MAAGAGAEVGPLISTFAAFAPYLAVAGLALSIFSAFLPN